MGGILEIIFGGSFRVFPREHLAHSHWILNTALASRKASARDVIGPEFTARAVRDWVGRLGVKTLYIEPGSPWENGYIESFNGKFRDEFLNREVLDTLLEARVLTAWWRREYNEVRPHSSLGYRPPVPDTICLLAATG